MRTVKILIEDRIGESREIIGGEFIFDWASWEQARYDFITPEIVRLGAEMDARINAFNKRRIPLP